MICGKINHLICHHSTGDSAKGRFSAQLACVEYPSELSKRQTLMAISSQLLSPLLLISWGSLLLPLRFSLWLCCHSEFNHALGKMQLPGGAEGGAKGTASQRVLGTSSHGLELHHLQKALPARLCWQWASQSGGNQNTDVVEGGCFVFSYIRVIFCALSIC